MKTSIFGSLSARNVNIPVHCGPDTVRAVVGASAGNFSLSLSLSSFSSLQLKIDLFYSLFSFNNNKKKKKKGTIIIAFGSVPASESSITSNSGSFSYF
jgi:hypothetical protein